MGLLNRQVLPDNKDEAHEWVGTDDHQYWFMRWRLYIKDWFAFATTGKQGIDLSFVIMPGLWLLPFTIGFTGWSWWYLFPVAIIPVARRWRKCPTVIFAMKGKGPWRIESHDASIDAPIEFPDRKFLFFPRIESSAASTMVTFMLSRVQYWTRWHFALQWPLIGQFHFYPNAADVIPAGTRGDHRGKVWNGYRGWHKDELAYWGDGGFLGRVFK